MTIPIEYRKALGLDAGSDVEFELRDDVLVLRKTGSGRRGARVVERLGKTSKSGMTTDELLALTRS